MTFYYIMDTDVVCLELEGSNFVEVTLMLIVPWVPSHTTRYVKFTVYTSCFYQDY